MHSTCTFTIHQPSLIRFPVPPYLMQISCLAFEIQFQRFPQITYHSHDDLSIAKWRNICSALTNLPNLTKLYVLIKQTYFFVGIRGTANISDMVVGVLQPLQQIHPRGGKGCYKVAIEWSLRDDERLALGDCPFDVIELKGEHVRNGK